MAGGHNLFAAPRPASYFSSLPPHQHTHTPAHAHSFVVYTHTQPPLIFFVCVCNAAPCMRYFGCACRRAVLLLCQHATMYSTDYQTPHLPLPNSFHAPTKHIPPDSTVSYKKVTLSLELLHTGRVTLWSWEM